MTSYLISSSLTSHSPHIPYLTPPQKSLLQKRRFDWTHFEMPTPEMPDLVCHTVNIWPCLSSCTRSLSNHRPPLHSFPQKMSLSPSKITKGTEGGLLFYILFKRLSKVYKKVKKISWKRKQQFPVSNYRQKLTEDKVTADTC